MIYDAIQGKKHVCYLDKNTELPFIYIDDLLTETIKYLETEQHKLIKPSYGISSFSITPQLMYDFLKKQFPDFEMEYKLDIRNEIALKWPATIDTKYSIKDWGFDIDYDFEKTINSMIEDIKLKIKTV